MNPQLLVAMFAVFLGGTTVIVIPPSDGSELNLDGNVLNLDGVTLVLI